MPDHPAYPDLKPIRLAFLGGGVDSAVGRAHYTAIRIDQCFELVAGCFSRDRECNEESARAYGVNPENIRDDLSALLDNYPKLYDAIVILTPTNQHCEQIETCLKRGIPVICEKAMVERLTDALTLQGVVQDNNGFLAVTYNYTGYPMIRELRSMINKGQLGTIQQIMLEMPQEGFARLDRHGNPITPQQWRLRDRGVPTVSLDLGVHLHMMVEFLTGENAVEVVAVDNGYGNFNEIVDSVSCIAKYPSDMTCNFWYSKAALGYRNGLKVRVFGSKGAAEWIQQDPEHLNLSNAHGDRRTLDRGSSDVVESNKRRYTRFKAGHPAGYIEAFANYYMDAAEQLTAHLKGDPCTDSPFVFGVRSEINGMALMEAIRRSAESKSWVLVNGH